jgi:hypothetical protein
MKTSQCGSRRILGWRFAIQTGRAWAMSMRVPSDTISDFFICEARLAQEAGQGRGLCLHAPFRCEPRRQFRHGHVARPGDGAEKKRPVRRKLAPPGGRPCRAGKAEPVAFTRLSTFTAKLSLRPKCRAADRRE